MSTNLHRLVYYSRNCLLGSSEEIALAIQQILETSRTNNSHAGVTGALMFNRGCFAQVLEGPRDAVETTFERIQQDDRHGTVMLLSFDAVSSRGFANWSMAHVGVEEDGTARYADIAMTTGFDPSRLTGQEIYRVLSRQLLDEEALLA